MLQQLQENRYVVTIYKKKCIIIFIRLFLERQLVK